ncbi:MAG: 50S ribosomal protein L21 [Armatimonadetes bacterium]|nr:50S ribosomal protein L21 [Armatimonadota bacterium]
MYAIVEVGGRQHMVEPDEIVKVDKLDAATGDEVSLDKVLAVRDDDGEMRIGRPYLDGVAVTARVVQQGRDRKLRVMKFRAKKRYLRHKGHRQDFTQLQITAITG